MNKANLFLILGLAGGTCLGLLASGSLDGVGSGAIGSAPTADMDHAQHQTGGMAHDHDRVQEVAPDAIPTIQIALQPEDPCTYNLMVTLNNFAFAPENVNGPHKDGEGHAHLYADGRKLGRIYSEWYHFSAPAGSKSIEVTLNSNDHATLAHEGKPITATAPLTDC